MLSIVGGLLYRCTPFFISTDQLSWLVLWNSPLQPKCQSMGLVSRQFFVLHQCHRSLLDLPLFAAAAHLLLLNFSRPFGALFPPTNVCNFPASPQLGFICRPKRSILHTVHNTVLTSTGGKGTRSPAKLCKNVSSQPFPSDCCHVKPQLCIKPEQNHLRCQRVMQQWGG